MQLFDELDKNNFILFAARNYYSPRCIDAEEFYDDLNRFKYIKRLVNRHQRGGDLGEKLLLNHPQPPSSQLPLQRRSAVDLRLCIFWL